MKLSKECIEAIEKQANSLIDCVPHKDDYKYGMLEALTNPSIYEKAGLISLEEALGFAELLKATQQIINRLDVSDYHYLSEDEIRLLRNAIKKATIYQEKKEK